MAKQVILSILLCVNLSLWFNVGLGQQRFKLNPGDTISCQLNSKSPKWIYARSADANLALAMYEDNDKILDLDESKGVKAVESFKFRPKDNKKYFMKV